MTKILIVHPGTQHSPHVAKQLYKKNMLYKLVTGLAISEGGMIGKVVKWLPSKIARPVSNRIITGVPASKLKTYPLTEYRFVSRAQKATNKEAVWFERNKYFQQKVPAKLIRNSDVLIGFDTSSWILQQRAKAMGKKFILDVSIAHSVSKNTVYKNIAAQYPAWSFALEHKSQQLLSVEQQEYEQADAIVVASQFTQQTLLDNGIAPNKIFINPYGIDANLFKLKETFYQSGPVKFIFVGIVDARKGIPLLMEVIKDIPPSQASFSFVGPVSNTIKEKIEDYGLPHVHIMGKVPHHALAGILGEHDVFVFPSYFEGFGLVILEAMAIGLPVITTTATAGPDCMEHGKEGFIMDGGDKAALQESINFFINHPNKIKEMGLAARKKAEQFSWDAYGDRYEKIINKVCANNN